MQPEISDSEQSGQVCTWTRYAEMEAFPKSAAGFRPLTEHNAEESLLLAYVSYTLPSRYAPMPVD